MVRVPDFSGANIDELNRLLGDERIQTFARTHPNPSGAQVDAFARSVEAEFGIEVALVRRLIRNERNRIGVAPVGDLEFDVQLQEAVNILRGGEFRALLEAARPLQALQEELIREREGGAAAS